MRIRTAFPALLAISLVAAPVLAAGSAPKGAPPGYEAKYKAVADAEKNEEFEKALSLLDEIPADKQTVYSRLKRSGLLVRLGRFVEAEEILSDLLKDPKADAIREVVRGDLDDLRARMPKLTVRMAKAAEGGDLWVTLDGNHVGPPATVPVNPGTHVVAATRAGIEVYKQKITIQDSQSMEVEIEPSAAPAPPIGNVSTVPTAPKAANGVEKDKPTSTTTPGYRRATPAFAVALVLAGGSVASFVIMTGAQRSLEVNCAAQPRHGCDVDTAGASRVRTWETLGWISGGLAVASVGVGIALWASGPADEKRAVAMVTPMVGSNVAGLGLNGRF